MSRWQQLSHRKYGSCEMLGGNISGSNRTEHLQDVSRRQLLSFQLCVANDMSCRVRLYRGLVGSRGLHIRILHEHHRVECVLAVPDWLLLRRDSIDFSSSSLSSGLLLSGRQY